MLLSTSEQWYRKDTPTQEYLAPDKGQWQGSCNRSCCQYPKSATWWHQDSLGFYCFACASLINKGASRYELRRLNYPTDDGLILPSSHRLHPHHNADKAQLVLDTSQGLFYTDDWLTLLRQHPVDIGALVVLMQSSAFRLGVMQEVGREKLSKITRRAVAHLKIPHVLERS